MLQDVMLDCLDYVMVVMVQGSLGELGVMFGMKGCCCFCGEIDFCGFCNVVYMLFEVFGNKWVILFDECDVCNVCFGVFDDVLVKSMGVILMVGGMQGKGNKVCQIGCIDGLVLICYWIVDGQ